MGYERYVDYALDVPMYFVYRDGRYIDVAGASFRDFMAGRLPQLPGEVATLDDWSDHVTTLFPEVRLKRFLEMRGADGGRWKRICALSAFWVGLLYDQAALDAAWFLVKDWSEQDRQSLREAVPRMGFAAPIRGTTAHEIAREAVAIAEAGLAARRKLDAAGHDETIYLQPLAESVRTGRTPADEMLARYETTWNRHIEPIFAEQAF
jgi:glutamate--cysteine ligase